MACKREQRFRRNTIAFWLSDDEKAEVEAKIRLSGLSKGVYYRRAVLGQEVQVIAGNYMSAKLVKEIKELGDKISTYNKDDAATAELIQLCRELKDLWEEKKESPYPAR